jgi:hypothetical protein
MHPGRSGRRRHIITGSTGTTAPSPDAVAPSTSAKAWAAAAVSGVLAFLSALLTALGGPETGFDTITAGQWLTAVIAGIGAFAAAGGGHLHRAQQAQVTRVA